LQRDTFIAKRARLRAHELLKRIDKRHFDLMNRGRIAPKSGMNRIRGRDDWRTLRRRTVRCRLGKSRCGTGQYEREYE
jgi:hypothetical protein